MRIPVLLAAAAVLAAAPALHAQPPPTCPVALSDTLCDNPEFQSCAIDVGGVLRHYCLHEPARRRRTCRWSGRGMGVPAMAV